MLSELLKYEFIFMSNVMIKGKQVSLMKFSWYMESYVLSHV